MSDLYDVIGTFVYDEILADPQGADLITIPVKPGNGPVPRGTVMFREDSGLYSPAEANDVADGKFLVVINENINSGDAPASGKTAVAEDAAAFRAGILIDGRVKLKNGTAVTAAQKLVLRKQGIVFNVKEGTGTFDNTVTGQEQGQGQS